VGAPTSTLQPSNLGAFDRRTAKPGSTAKSVSLHPPTQPEFGKPLQRQEIREMLEPAMFIGLGLVAAWAHLRFPRLRPSSLLRAILRVAVSFAAFASLPAGLGLLLPLAPSPAQARYIVLALLFPTLTYVLLTWIWLLARILQELSGGAPRGGHPVSSES
jgi:hypothetical protein